MTPLPFSEPYPDRPAARTRWIVERRSPKNTLDSTRPYAAFVEDEAGPDGATWPVATLFLTNRECAFRCLMCDLWRDTLDTPTPPGAIPAQIETALAALPPARAVKLYNAGSFFDPGQVPPEDDPAIAARVRSFDRVIVECHTAFLRGSSAARALRFQAAIRPAALEVAIGLETVHPEALARLNKRMTLGDFRRAAAFLRESGIALRVFLLVRPPFLTEDEGVAWACRSLDVAREAGATLSALIPTRGGNGAMEALQEAGEFAPPSLESLETCLRYGLAAHGAAMRVTGDLWDIGQGESDRVARIKRMNRTQRLPESALPDLTPLLEAGKPAAV